MSSQTPFSTFDGHVKCLRLDWLMDGPGLEAAALQFACGEFLKRSQINSEGNEANTNLANSLGISLAFHEDAFGYRRFAGDSSLLRNRYFSVCRDQTGNDYETLRMELIAYIDHLSAGEVYIHDLKGPDAIAIWTLFSRFLSSLSPDDDYLIFDFHSKGERRNPFFDTDFWEGRYKPDIDQFPVFVSFIVEQVTIDKCIDLRLMETRDWLYRSMVSGVPGLLYIYGDEITNGIRLSGNKRGDERKFDKYNLPDGPRIFYAPWDKWERAVIETPDMFYGLLLYLMFPLLGGSPITDGLGGWFRSLGANALVYPSARNDNYCHISNGHLMEFGGWNLVDYRGSPTYTMRNRLIFEPDSWKMIQPGAKISIAPEHSENYGSFKIIGVREGLIKHHDNKIKEFYANGKAGKNQ